jgi:hypothetical protein
MRLASLKSNSSRVRTPHPQSAADCEIDEALGAAYRRYDKGAVTKQLLRRYLMTVTAVACCIHGPAGRRPGIKGSAQGTGHRPIATNEEDQNSHRRGVGDFSRFFNYPDEAELIHRV